MENQLRDPKENLKNDERDEKSPVEIIEGRLKRLRMNEIYARLETQTLGREGVGGREKQRQLGRGKTDE